MKIFLFAIILFALSVLSAPAKGADGMAATVPDSVQTDTATTERHGMAQYAMTYDDWRNGNLSDIDGVREESRSNAKKFWSGGGDVKLTTGNKTYDAALKNNVFVVRTDSALYVSLSGLKAEGYPLGKNFTRAWTLPDGTLVFAFMPWGKSEAKSMTTSALFFGIAGAAIQAGKQMRAAKVLYAITDGSHSVQRLTKNALHDLLAPWPEVQAEVDGLSADSTYDYSLVLQCMREGGIRTNR